MTTHRRLLSITLATTASLLPLACGGGGGGDSAPDKTIPPGAVVVTAGPGLVLDQSEYAATATNGQVTIAYVQKDAQRHTLAVRNEAGIVIGKKLEVVKVGDIDSASYDLGPGTYQMIYCDVPGHGSMKASLRVT